jgi:hypothetical protein
MRRAIVCLIFLALATACLTLAAADQTINNCPIPDDMKIVEPDKNEVPPKLALLSGIWEGNWGTMSVLFIVEKLNKKEAIVLHSVSGRQVFRAASIPPNYFRKPCSVEKGEDGNYHIVMALSQGTNKLIQTNDPQYIRVTREGFSGLSTETRDSVFRKKEIK